MIKLWITLGKQAECLPTVWCDGNALPEGGGYQDFFQCLPIRLITVGVRGINLFLHFKKVLSKGWQQ